MGKHQQALKSAGFTPLQAEVLVDIFQAKKKTKANEENIAVWEAYREIYVARYGTEPVRNPTVNNQIKQLVRRLGEETIEVVKFYVKHNGAFYVQKCHPIGLCLADAESLRTQWSRGQTVTQGDAKRMETREHYRTQMERIEKGEL